MGTALIASTYDNLMNYVQALFSILTCSPAALTVQAAGVRWGSPPSFQVAATSSGVR
jgi:hypothetical protein